MGKPKKGGFPAMEPKTNYVSIQKGEMDNITIAWGDSVVWINRDPVPHKVAPLASNGQPDPNRIWADLSKDGTDDANSSPLQFQWTEKTPPPAQPQVFEYGLVDAPNVKAKITAQIKV
ncbi:MAG TPA: hypothetical protein VHU83_05985 [Bryobacteraceae bacterium]|jgi:hypothetical protein|nr:hypothetical protein [Bryobacteraceae bacterium]